jgi:hypothetical protein
VLPLTAADSSTPPLPHFAEGAVVINAPGAGVGYWAGGPSAVRVGADFYLAYRLRRPVAEGRGYGIVIARSTDGEAFETVLELDKDQFDCESLERPALAVAPDGAWRLYVSCATPGTLHWRVDALEAADPAAFDPKSAATMLAGDPATAFKDPVIFWADGLWHMWVCVHLVADPNEADRMFSQYAVSNDGFHWSELRTALTGRPGEWDQRGTRISAVLLQPERVVAYYDGRAKAEENWEEQTGLAFGADPGALTAEGPEPVATSPHPGGGLRYVSVVALDDGGHRLFYEVTGPDGSHDLRTEYAPPVR